MKRCVNGGSDDMTLQVVTAKTAHREIATGDLTTAKK